jgi:hypothetical protein
MGWASGADLAEEVWKAVEGHIPPEKVREVAEKIAAVFRKRDCDTLQEIEGPIGWADQHESFVRWFKAPKNPKAGHEIRADGELYRWNGARWVAC